MDDFVTVQEKWNKLPKYWRGRALYLKLNSKPSLINPDWYIAQTLYQALKALGYRWDGDYWRKA